MKRLLSWLALYAGAAVFDFLNSKLWELVFWASREISSLSRVLFFILLLAGGTTILGIAACLCIYGGAGVAKLSQLVRHSSKGKRYLVCMVIYLVYGALNLIGALVGVIIPRGQVIAIALCEILFGLSVLWSGKALVSEDGAPPSKVEELERKIEKLKAKEMKEDNGYNS